MNIRNTNRLTVLAAEIQAADGRFRRSADDAAAAAIEAGHKLIEAKSLVRHGEWRAWLDHHCAISERSSQRYMQLAKSGMEIRHVADLGIRAASEAAGKKSPAKPVASQSMAEAVLCWFSMVVSWAHKAPKDRQNTRLAVVDAFMNGAEEWEKLASVWLKQTKAIEADIAVCGTKALHPGLTDEQIISKARRIMSELLPDLAKMLPAEPFQVPII